MPTGRLVALLALGYAGLCFVFLGVLALLAALLYWLSQNMALAPALLLTGLAGLAPIVIGILAASSHGGARAQPVKLDLQSLIGELGVLMGREASDLVHEKPWHTILIAAAVGFVAAANPGLAQQILKGLRRAL